MSQPPQSSSSPRLSLPVLKFSHATVAEGLSAPIPWKHIVSNHDLFVVLDVLDAQGPAGATEKRQRFQVYHGPDVLEDIDLDILASEAQKANSQAQMCHDNRGFPAIIIVAKTPCLAMRYPLSGARVRRFQVRFAEPEGFYETMKRLSKTGVPFTEADQAPPVPPAPQIHSSMNNTMNQNGGYPDYQPSTAVAHNGFGINHRNVAYSGSTIAADPPRPITSNGIPVCSQGIPSTAPEPWLISHPHRRAFDQNSATPTTLCTNLNDQFRVHSAPSAIDLYTPRPQPTTVSDQSKPQDVMPPKRELPFSKVKKTNLTRDNTGETTPTTRAAVIDIPAGKEDNGNHEEVSIIQDVNKIDDAKSKKRMAPKVEKAPTTKKSKPATTRKKPGPKTKRQDTPIPSVEELLKNIIGSKSSTKSSWKAADTQELIHQAESKIQNLQSTKEQELGKLATDATARSVSQVDVDEAQATTSLTKKRTNSRRNPSQRSQAEVPVAAVASKPSPSGGKCRAPTASHLESNSSTDRIENSEGTISTEVEVDRQLTGQVAVQTSVHPLAEADQTRPQPQSQPQQSPSASSSLPSLSPSLSPRRTTLPSTITSNPQMNKLFTQAISPGRTDRTDPSNPPDNTKQDYGHDQQPTIQSLLGDDAKMHRVIENYICQQIDNDDFLQLCKVMDTVSARIFVRY